MALVPVDISSYQAFRTEVLARAASNLGYDVDGTGGYAGWDLAAELWMHIPEFSSGLWPKKGTYNTEYGIWLTEKETNAGSSFTLITSKTNIKRGDIIVLGPSGQWMGNGHIAFADEDYNGTDFLYLLGQNQVDTNPNTGHIPTLDNLSIEWFYGAFRYNGWGGGPTPPVTSSRKSRLPLILTTRRLLDNML